jgi:hypothetical protein
MTKAKAKLVRDARAAGFEVRESVTGRLAILRRTPVTRKVLRGLILYPDRTGFDARVAPGVAKGLRSDADLRRVLGL